MGMELRLSHIQKQELTLEQKQELKQQQKISQDQKLELSMRLSLELKSPAPAEVIRGLEGVSEADKILKEHNLVGILIGSLAKKVWERTHDPEDFLLKDVDVLVLDENIVNSKIKYGDGGIDWWLPKEKFIAYIDRDGSKIEKKQKFFKNINGAILNFCSEAKEKNNPGLYLLTLEQLIAMQFTESSSVIKDLSSIDEVFEKYDEHQRRSYQKIPSKHMMENFGNNFIPQVVFEELSGHARNALKKNLDVK